jgi:adenosine/AMP kinase
LCQANPSAILVAVTRPRPRHRRVVDESAPFGVETDRDLARHRLLRQIGYKL